MLWEEDLTADGLVADLLAFGVLGSHDAVGFSCRVVGELRCWVVQCDVDDFGFGTPREKQAAYEQFQERCIIALNVMSSVIMSSLASSSSELRRASVFAK